MTAGDFSPAQSSSGPYFTVAVMKLCNLLTPLIHFIKCIKFEFVPHRKHYLSVAKISRSVLCKETFGAGTSRNTQTQSVSNVYRFNTLKQVIYI
jgi:hypothetical protein